MGIYRQGDVAFIPVKDRDLARQLRGGSVWMDRPVKRLTTRIIRRGENGGVHTLDPAVKEAVLVEFQGKRYVLSETGVRVLHREHKALSLPAGVHEIRVQREIGMRGQREVQRQVYD